MYLGGKWTRRLLWVCLWAGMMLHPARSTAGIAVEFVPVCRLQGSGLVSPYENQLVRTQGVVYADFDQLGRKGIFIQDTDCDGDPGTSDGLFVYLGERGEFVRTGDLIQVTGRVQEYEQNTEIVVQPVDLLVVANDQPLPEAEEWLPPPDGLAAGSYGEAHENMYMQISQAIAIGSTGDDDRSWLVPESASVERVFADNPGQTGLVLCVDDAGLAEISPELSTGDRLAAVQGALELRQQVPCLQLVSQPQVFPQPLIPVAAPPGDGLRVASLNMYNLFDSLDDPSTDDSVLSVSEYQRRLQKRAILIHEWLNEPDLLAVQEVENGAVLQALLARQEITAEYAFAWLEGPDRRGLDVALLYRPDHLQLVEYQALQGCTALVDGLGPDGNLNVLQPENALSCDRDGDGQVDGNRLFSRPPLLAHFIWLQAGSGSNQPVDEASNPAGDVWLFDIHLKSKTEDSSTQAYSLPRRLEQAGFLAAAVAECRRQGANNLILLGDFNDGPASAPLAILRAAGLRSLDERLPAQERYSYIYQGLSQLLDHLLVAWDSPLFPVETSAIHINADFPAELAGDDNLAQRSSDHDPLFAIFQWRTQHLVLPLVMAGGTTQ